MSAAITTHRGIARPVALAAPGACSFPVVRARRGGPRGSALRLLVPSFAMPFISVGAPERNASAERIRTLRVFEKAAPILDFSVADARPRSNSGAAGSGSSAEELLDDDLLVDVDADPSADRGRGPLVEAHADDPAYPVIATASAARPRGRFARGLLRVIGFVACVAGVGVGAGAAMRSLTPAAAAVSAPSPSPPEASESDARSPRAPVDATSKGGEPPSLDPAPEPSRPDGPISLPPPPKSGAPAAIGAIPVAAPRVAAPAARPTLAAPVRAASASPRSRSTAAPWKSKAKGR